MELYKLEEVNTLNKNHLEYRKLIPSAKKKCLMWTIIIFKETYFPVFLLGSPKS